MAPPRSRKRADFPTGKEQSTAYHKGLAELENRLLVTSEFSETDGEGTKHHGLMFVRRPQDVQAAEKMSREEAIMALLKAYLPTARYIMPGTLSTHLRVPKVEILEALEALSSQGLVSLAQAPEIKGPIWLAR